MVIHGSPQALLAAQIPLGRLDRNVPQQELDLLKLPAGGVAKPRTRAPTVMGRQPGNPGGARSGLHNVPDHLLRNALAPNRALPADATEQSALSTSPTCQPRTLPSPVPGRSECARPCPPGRRLPNAPPVAGCSRFSVRLPHAGVGRIPAATPGLPCHGGPSDSQRLAPGAARLCSAVNQFPSRTPMRLAPFTRRMPAAKSGLRSPVSAAS